MLPSSEELLQQHQSGQSFTEIAKQYGVTKGVVAGRIFRAQQKLIDKPDLFKVDLGKPWSFTWENCIVIGDVQIPTMNYDFAALPMAIAKKYLKRPRRLIIAGDLINADAFSTYESDYPTPSMEQEIDAGQQFFEEYLTVFDEIYWFVGNHERRVGKRTRAAIKPEHLLRLMTHDKRVQISHWGHCLVNTSQGTYRVLHGSNYSVNQLNVNDQLAAKYHQHIIGHHQHHFAKGWDRYKRYVIIDNGGLFDTESMAYALLDDNKSPCMVNGFTMLKDGYPTLFGTEPFTNWDEWLPARAS